MCLCVMWMTVRCNHFERLSRSATTADQEGSTCCTVMIVIIEGGEKPQNQIHNERLNRDKPER